MYPIKCIYGETTRTGFFAPISVQNRPFCPDVRSMVYGLGPMDCLPRFPFECIWTWPFGLHIYAMRYIKHYMLRESVIAKEDRHYPKALAFLFQGVSLFIPHTF